MKCCNCACDGGLLKWYVIAGMSGMAAGLAFGGSSAGGAAVVCCGLLVLERPVTCSLLHGFGLSAGTRLGHRFFGEKASLRFPQDM